MLGTLLELTGISVLRWEIDIPRRTVAVDTPEELNERRNRLVKLWHEYGERFGVFDPKEQPAPETWEPALPEPDEKGRRDPQCVKHWKHLFDTKQFLRERYAEFRILEGPSMEFDCLVQKILGRIHHLLIDGEKGLFQQVEDTGDLYTGVLRLGVWKWHVGFSCKSIECHRDWCKLHHRNPNRINPVDIFSLIQIFDGCDLTTAFSAVRKGFGYKLRPFKAGELGAETKLRYAVPKQVVYELIQKYQGMRLQHIDGLVKEAHALVQGFSMVPWHSRLFNQDIAYFSHKVVGNLYRIKGPAIKAYLWLLIRQEELARQTNPTKDTHKAKWKLRVSDPDLAKALGVTRDTAASYREKLETLDLVEVETKSTGQVTHKFITKVKYR